jgi:hypothetical protein
VKPFRTVRSDQPGVPRAGALRFLWGTLRLRWGTFILLAPLALNAPTAVATEAVAAAAGAVEGSGRDGEDIATFSIRDQPVGQVLLAFAEETGLSVITDSTVSGRISLVLHDMSAREVLYQIATAADLFVDDRHGVYHLSRISFHRDRDDRWQLGARGVTLPNIGAVVARESGTGIIIATDYPEPVVSTADGSTVLEVLENSLAGLPVIVREETGGLIIRDRDDDDRSDGGTPFTPTATVDITGADTPEGGITLAASGATDGEICHAYAEASQSVLVAAHALGTRRESLRLSGPDWPDMDSRLEAALDISIRREGDLLLVQPPRGGDSFAGLRRRLLLETAGSTAPKVAGLLASIPGISVEWVEDTGDRILISGFSADLSAAREIMEELAGTGPQPAPFLFRCTGNDAAVVAEALALRFPRLDFQVDIHSNSVLSTVPRGSLEEVTTYAAGVDDENPRLIYRCAFVAPAEAREKVAAIYPGVSGVEGTDGRTVVFHASPPLHGRIRNLMEEIDQPIPQIRYDLCIIQYQHGDGRQRGLRASVDSGESTAVFGPPLGFSAGYDRITTLQFDILSALGYRAALGLSEELTNNTARLLIDTSIHGRNGVTARVENASTYRYRDVLGDDDTDGYRAVTREIDTGLIVELTGTVQDDRSVAVDISVTISKNGTDMSTNGNPPTTSRKLIETRITAFMGEPVVIGGLLHRESDRGEQRFPFLGRIPVLRRLVNNHRIHEEETEFVLYLSVFSDNRQPEAAILAGQLRDLDELIRQFSEEEDALPH